MSAEQADDTPGLGTLSGPVPRTRVRIHPGSTPTPAALQSPEPTGFGTPNSAKLPDLILNSAQAIRFDSELGPGHSYRLQCLRTDGAFAVSLPADKLVLSIPKV